MEIIPSDWRECVELFASHEVDFLIVGALALAFHGHPRYTGDLDLFVRNTRSNAERVVAALSDFGFGSAGLRVEDLMSDDMVIQLGVRPRRIDLLTFLTAVPFEEAWLTRVDSEIEGLTLPVLSKELLIRNKLALARPQDLVDAAILAD